MSKEIAGSSKSDSGTHLVGIGMGETGIGPTLESMNSMSSCVQPLCGNPFSLSTCKRDVYCVLYIYGQGILRIFLVALLYDTVKSEIMARATIFSKGPF